MELDDLIIEEILENKNKNDKFKDETIYIIQYPEGKLFVYTKISLTIFSINAVLGTDHQVHQF